MANKNLKRYSTLLISRGMQTTTRYHLTPVRRLSSKRTQITSLCEDVVEKTMAPHSSTLAWKIPWMEERSRLQSMGSLRVGHD